MGLWSIFLGILTLLGALVVANYVYRRWIAPAGVVPAGIAMYNGADVNYAGIPAPCVMAPLPTAVTAACGCNGNQGVASAPAEGTGQFMYPGSYLVPQIDAGCLGNVRNKRQC